jgi:hypothetical protein
MARAAARLKRQGKVSDAAKKKGRAKAVAKGPFRKKRGWFLQKILRRSPFWRSIWKPSSSSLCGGPSRWTASSGKARARGAIQAWTSCLPGPGVTAIIIIVVCCPCSRVIVTTTINAATATAAAIIFFLLPSCDDLCIFIFTCYRLSFLSDFLCKLGGLALGARLKSAS